MELYVLNRNFETIKVFDIFQSLIWTDRYDEAGDFEIYTQMNPELLTYLAQDNYLMNPDSEHLMIIENISINTDDEDGDVLKVTGHSLEYILNRRIVWNQTILYGSLQDSIKKLLEDAIINPSDPNRKISNFIFKESDDERIKNLRINTQYTGDDLYEVICTLCNKNGIGFKIILNNNQFEFSLYCGVDRSYGQIINPYVVFSYEFDNIISSNYYQSKANYKNVTLVAGEGEGASRITTSIGDASGLNRRELYTDARDISSDVGEETPMTMEEYIEQLVERGTDKLSECVAIESFEGEAEAYKTFVYGDDFYIGDIVQVADGYGHEGKAYISELVMSQNESGISVYPTFKTI